MNWMTHWLWPRAAISDLQADVMNIRLAILGQTADLNTIKANTREIRTAMALDRELLATIAAGLTALAGPVTDLIASEAALRARVAELESAAAADEAGDLAAAGAVKAAFDDLAGKFTAEPEAPDVEPLPEPATDPDPVD